MADLLPWDPFNDLMSIGETMTRNIFGGFWQPSIDVVERPEEFIVRANLPGMNRDDVELTVENNSLIIRGEAKREEVREDEHYYRRERRFGSFMRTIPFHGKIKADQVRASFKDGVLEVLLPKEEVTSPRGRKIEIQ